MVVAPLTDPRMGDSGGSTDSRDYLEFLASKRLVVRPSGRKVEPSDVHPALFPFQSDLVRWAARKGRAAIFADTGLGKTIMQVEWAKLIEETTLIVSPLSVAQQTIDEARSLLDYEVVYSPDGRPRGQITVTNYDRVDKFNPEDFGAVVLDESSILKSINSKTRRRLTDAFRETPYRLCCTATPAPNDVAEIANHAEFLGIMTRAEMLAAFFVHRAGGPGDRQGWHLKGHAREPFFRWLASWGMAVKKPSDIGYSDEGYDLPGLDVTPHFLPVDYLPPGQLLFTELRGITDRANVRRETTAARVEKVVDLCRSSTDQWIVWCGTNDESSHVASGLGGECVEVRGSQSAEEKTERIRGFQRGDVRVLVTKPSIAGFGLNFQHCHRMAFCGLSDSWESYYQCVRRCYRFGQSSRVAVHVVLSEPERAIYDNVMRKESEAVEMGDELIANAASYEKEELDGSHGDRFEYATDEVDLGDARLLLGDAVERIREIDDVSVGLSIYSPPFESLYTYSDTERDLGNSTSESFWQQYDFLIPQILRVTMPGRHTCVHCQQLSRTKQTHGYMGLHDFRGDLIRAYEKHGWIYHGEVCIDKCPQAQAIRTKSHSLMFVTKERDSSWLRPALADYILVFRKPGDNPEPIRGDVTNDEWIQWARPIWYGIRESDVLKVAEGRDEKDEKHICPLQLETIERCVRLWSNQGELVFSPFMGIGSEGYASVSCGRRFVGIELKPSYFRAATKNVRSAIKKKGRQLEFFAEGEQCG